MNRKDRILITWHDSDGIFHCVVWQNGGTRKGIQEAIDYAAEEEKRSGWVAWSVIAVDRKVTRNMTPRQMAIDAERRLLAGFVR